MFSFIFYFIFIYFILIYLYYFCIYFCRINAGSLSLMRDHSRRYTFSPAASSADAPHEPCTSVQSVPTVALFIAQRSYSRGYVPDIRGVLVQSGRAGYDCFTSLRGEGPPQGPGSG